MTEARLALPDRRGLAAYQADIFPGLLAEIHAAAGFALPVEVRWTELAVPGQGARYGEPEFFTNIYFRPLAIALARIARDDMGREALRAGLRQVVIGHDPDSAPATAYENGVVVADGVVTINFRPWTNTGDIEPRAAALVAAIEAAL